jgi:hypothetical protein
MKLYRQHWQEGPSSGWTQAVARFVKRRGVRQADLRRVFDEDWYRKRHPEVAARGIDPLNHYLEQGAAAGYDPHPAFCTNWYLHRYPDVAGAGINPLVHYVRDGAFERRDPHPLFDAGWYVARHPEVAASGVNPLVHYIKAGAAEGFSPGPLFKGPEDWEIDPAEATERRADYDRGQPPRQLAVVGPKRDWTQRLIGAPSAAVVGTGMFCYRRGYLFPASIAFKVALLVPVRRDQLRMLLAQCDVRRGKFDRAFAWFLQQSNLTPPPGLTITTTAMPRPSVSNEAGGAVCVITSVMPKRIEAQQAALNSWRAAGLSVVSVNSPPEVTQLREHFPDVTFQTIERPAVDTRGRPLIPISAMIQAAANAPGGVCGIINSDIEFRGDPSVFDSVRRRVAGSLIFGNRIDVADRGFGRGKAYRKGYDFFFWDRKNSALLEDSPMVLGLPWWDFWLPLHAYGRGLATKRLATSSFVHVVHPVGYDVPTFVKFGHRFADALAEAYSRWDGSRVSPERAFLHRLFATGALIPADSDADAAPRGMDALRGLANCLVDALSETVVLPDARLASGTLDLL